MGILAFLQEILKLLAAIHCGVKFFKLIFLAVELCECCSIWCPLEGSDREKALHCGSRPRHHVSAALQSCRSWTSGRCTAADTTILHSRPAQIIRCSTDYHQTEYAFLFWTQNVRIYIVEWLSGPTVHSR